MKNSLQSTRSFQTLHGKFRGVNRTSVFGVATVSSLLIELLLKRNNLLLYFLCNLVHFFSAVYCAMYHMHHLFNCHQH